MSRLEGMESTGFKTRMRVVEALAEIAGEGGFEKATINSICKSAGEGMPYDMHRLCQYLEDVVPRRLHDLLDRLANPLPW